LFEISVQKAAAICPSYAPWRFMFIYYYILKIHDLSIKKELLVENPAKAKHQAINLINRLQISSL
jgi:hypothetical protein